MEDRPVNALDGETDEELDVFGWLLLLAVLAAVMWFFGALVASGVDNDLHGAPFTRLEGTLTGIELAIVPLTALVSFRVRMREHRFQLRLVRHLEAWVPHQVAMVAALSVTVVYLVFVWISSLAVLGPPPEFGLLRWLVFCCWRDSPGTSCRSFPASPLHWLA